MLWLLRMVELTPISVWAIKLVVEIVALFGSIIRVNMRFLLQLVFSMSKRTLLAERTLWHLPVSAYFGLKLLLEIRLRRHNFPRFHRNDVKVRKSAQLISFLINLWIRILGVLSARLLNVYLVLILLIVKIEVIAAAIDDALHVNVNIVDLALRRIVLGPCRTKIILLLLLWCELCICHAAWCFLLVYFA